MSTEQKATPGRIIQVHVADEWLVAMVLARTENALGDLPGFLARVFSVYNGNVPEVTGEVRGHEGNTFLSERDFNAPFADEHLGKTWRWPPREGA